MTSRKSFSAKKGMILVDAMMALAISALFISLIAGSSMQSRSIYERAKDREGSLRDYEDSSSTLVRSFRLYGNDRTEEVIASGLISFDKVRANLFSDYFESAGTPLCSVETASSNAASAVSIAAIPIPVSPTLPFTHLQVRNGIAYISTDSTVAADPDLIIADIHDPGHPEILSSINTGPGIASFAIAGKRIFAGAASTAGQLHVIRLDSLRAPVLEFRYQLPLPYATATAPFASAIFYDAGLVYLGTEKWDGPEFSIIDVADPVHPRSVGSFETGSKVNDIYVRDGLAYVAAADQSQLRIIDVHDHAHPLIKSSFSPTGWERQEGKAVSVFEDALSFGRTSGGFDIKSDHELFSTSSPSHASFSRSLNFPGGIYGIVNYRTHLFAISHQAGKELVAFDYTLSSTTAGYHAFPTLPQSITCDNDRLYVLSGSAPYIYEASFE